MGEIELFLAVFAIGGFRTSILALIIVSVGTWRTSAANGNSLILDHVTVIDATGSAPQPNMSVVITGDRISAIRKSVDKQPSKDAEIVNAMGKFLIPGLWDMHGHWYEKDYLPLFIANGVTGIRLMWGMPMHREWRKEIEEGKLLGPRLLIASTIVDGPNPVWPGSIVASNETEGREAVKKAKAEGADFVKVYSLLPRNAYFAIADEAKKEGIPFVGHVPISVSAEEASICGQKSIEHLDGILLGCSGRQAEFFKTAEEILQKNPATNGFASMMAAWRRESELSLDSYNPENAKALFAAFKRNHTWQCPTLTVLRLVTLDASPTNDVRLKYMPPDVRSDWNRARLAKFQAFGERYFKKHLELAAVMQRAGVGILAGTDTLNPFCFPGFGLHDELEFLDQAGLTPMEALQAATRNPARFMDREKELGTIEKGKIADLVLLDANPLDNIANVRRINAVIYRGKLYSRNALDEMLRKAKVLAHADPPAKN